MHGSYFPGVSARGDVRSLLGSGVNGCRGIRSTEMKCFLAPHHVRYGDWPALWLGESRDSFSPMSHKSRTETNDFTCIHCKGHVPVQAWGTRHRNHCPLCLWSRHVDDEPGDRACACRSGMEPIGIEVRQDGEWALIHRCTGCGTIGTNRVAGDDEERSLLALALRPIANPAFPLDGFRGR